MIVENPSKVTEQTSCNFMTNTIIQNYCTLIVTTSRFIFSSIHVSYQFVTYIVPYFHINFLTLHTHKFK